MAKAGRRQQSTIIFPVSFRREELMGLLDLQVVRTIWRWMRNW
jgi:hypothetical protein